MIMKNRFLQVNGHKKQDNVYYDTFHHNIFPQNLFYDEFLLTVLQT